MGTVFEPEFDPNDIYGYRLDCWISGEPVVLSVELDWETASRLGRDHEKMCDDCAVSKCSPMVLSHAPEVSVNGSNAYFVFQDLGLLTFVDPVSDVWDGKDFLCRVQATYSRLHRAREFCDMASWAVEHGRRVQWT